MKLSINEKNILNDIISTFTGKEKDAPVNFYLRRYDGSVKQTIKVEDSLPVNARDLVYSRGLSNIIREACDCPYIAASRWVLALRMGLCSRFFYTKNVKAGVITYNSFRKIRDYLKTYKKFLKSWHDFTDVKFVPRGELDYVKTTYKPLNKFDLNKYNAGARTRKLMAKAVHPDDDRLVVFTDKEAGLVISRRDFKDTTTVVHNMGGDLTAEPLYPIKREVDSSREKTLTVRGMRYALADKGDELR